MKLRNLINESGSERAKSVQNIETEIQKICLNFLKNMDENVFENSKDLTFAIMSHLHKKGIL